MLAGVVTYWSEFYPIDEPNWKTVYHSTSPKVLKYGVWNVFDASNVSFEAGKLTEGELTLVGETYGQQQQTSNQPSHTPTLCVFTEPEFDHIQVNQPSDIQVPAFQHQAEGCYQKYNYYSSNETYVIPFEWNSGAAGGYYFVFLTNVPLVPYGQSPFSIVVSQEDFVPNQFQKLLPILLQAVAGVYAAVLFWIDGRKASSQS